MHIRKATVEDVDAVAALVERAYQVYVPRIGRRPAPMDDDYAALVSAGKVFVIEEPGTAGGGPRGAPGGGPRGGPAGIAGLIVLSPSTITSSSRTSPSSRRAEGGASAAGCSTSPRRRHAACSSPSCGFTPTRR